MSPAVDSLSSSVPVELFGLYDMQLLDNEGFGHAPRLVLWRFATVVIACDAS